MLQRSKCNGEGNGNKSYNDILTENLAENEVTRNGNGLSVVRNKRIREKKSVLEESREIKANSLPWFRAGHQER